MKSQDVRNWLQDPNRSYEVGVQIYEQFAPAKSAAQLNFFKQNLDAQAGSLHFNQLFQKVSAILPKVECLEASDSLPSEKVQQIEIKPTVFAKKEIPPFKDAHRFDVQLDDVNKLPEDLQEKYKENQLLVAELASLRADLEHADSDEARKELADEICLKDDIRAANWEAIDAYYAELKPLAVSVEEEINKCKTYISRLFNSKTEKVQQEVASRTAYLAQNGVTVSVESGKVVYGKKS